MDSQQHTLAADVEKGELRLAQESKIAYLKIQSWQFAMRTPEIGKAYIKEAANMLQQTFFQYIPNKTAINEPDYFN